MNDTGRLDWLEKNQGYAVVSDDCRHWACVSDGVQNVLLSYPGDISTSFFVEKNQWKKSIRKAIDAAIKEAKDAN